MKKRLRKWLLLPVLGAFVGRLFPARTRRFGKQRRHRHYWRHHH